jgi:hypothetical protein
MLREATIMATFLRRSAAAVLDYLVLAALYRVLSAIEALMPRLDTLVIRLRYAPRTQGSAPGAVLTPERAAQACAFIVRTPHLEDWGCLVECTARQSGVLSTVPCPVHGQGQATHPIRAG